MSCLEIVSLDAKFQSQAWRDVQRFAPDLVFLQNASFAGMSSTKRGVALPPLTFSWTDDNAIQPTGVSAWIVAPDASDSILQPARPGTSARGLHGSTHPGTLTAVILDLDGHNVAVANFYLDLSAVTSGATWDGLQEDIRELNNRFENLIIIGAIYDVHSAELLAQWIEQVAIEYVSKAGYQVHYANTNNSDIGHLVISRLSSFVEVDECSLFAYEFAQILQYSPPLRLRISLNECRKSLQL